MNMQVFIGIVLSLLFIELTGLSPGGIITPAYFALFVYDAPLRILLTFIIAVLSFAIMRLLSRYAIIYGKRRYIMYLLCGMAIKALFSLPQLAGLAGLPSLSLSIGFLIPGLIGHDMERQGIFPTIFSICIVVALLLLVSAFLAG